VRKAKELLTTGKFTISEAARHFGFADQSHLRVISKEFSAYLRRGC
jgi:AraC-like DNA-binding protein